MVIIKNYHPDLLYLRKYLELISFYKIAEYSLKDIPNPNNSNELKIASENTEVALKLNLALKIKD